MTTTYAIGDIHGCLTALETLLDAAGPTSDDRLVTLGDYIDRGPDSRGVIDRLIRLRDEVELVSIQGNHEQMMMLAREGAERFDYWMMCGGRPAIDSYAPADGVPGRLPDVPDEHWAFLDDVCRDWFETDTNIYVHANLIHDMDLAEQPDWRLRWESLNPETAVPHQSGKVMVCGHTAQKSGVPLNIGHAICIDTYIYGGQWLTCLDPATGRYWQANQAGESRDGWIDEC